MPGFVGQNPFLGSATAGAFLASKFFDACPLGIRLALPARLNFVEQQAAGQDSVASLMAGLLALDLDARRTMKEHDAGGGFVDVLPAVASGANERFLDVLFANAEGGHASPNFIIALDPG
jgi:hypothetical protein